MRFRDKRSLKKTNPQEGGKKEPGTELFSQTVTRQVSSPLQRFTTEFGMGRSGSTAPSAPGNAVSSESRTFKTACHQD